MSLSPTIADTSSLNQEFSIVAVVREKTFSMDVESSLFGAVELSRSQALNVAPPHVLSDVIRPVDTAEERTASLTNLDLDSGVLVHVSFTDSPRVRKVVLGTGTGDDACSHVRVWVNRNGRVDWDDVDNLPPDAEWVPRREHNTVEYPLNPAPRFNSTSSLSLYFVPTSQQATLRIFYIGFKGYRGTRRLEQLQNISVRAELGGEAARVKEKSSTTVKQPVAY